MAQELNVEYLFSGYIRKNIQYQLKKQVIPSSIIKLCEDYYPIYEFIDFSIYNKQAYQRIEVETKSKIILKAKEFDHFGGFFSQQGFDNGVHKWSIICIKSGGDIAGSPGIITNNDDKLGKNDVLMTDEDETKTFNWLSWSTMGDSYYYHNRYLNEYINGQLTNSTTCHEFDGGWIANDRLIMTLDFNQKIFKIERVRNKENVMYEIEIDVNKTYYPCFGLVNGELDVQFEMVMK